MASSPTQRIPSNCSTSLLSESDENNCQLIIAEDFTENTTANTHKDESVLSCQMPQFASEKSSVHTVETFVSSTTGQEKSTKVEKVGTKSSGLDDILNSIAHKCNYDTNTIFPPEKRAELANSNIITSLPTTSAMQLVKEFDSSASSNLSCRPSRPNSTPPKLLLSTLESKQLSSLSISKDTCTRNHIAAYGDALSVRSMPDTCTGDAPQTMATSVQNTPVAINLANIANVIGSVSVEIPKSTDGSPSHAQIQSLTNGIPSTLPYKSMLSALEEDIDSSYSLDASNYFNATISTPSTSHNANSLASTIDQVISSQCRINSVEQLPVANASVLSEMNGQSSQGQLTTIETCAIPSKIPSNSLTLTLSAPLISSGNLGGNVLNAQMSKSIKRTLQQNKRSMNNPKKSISRNYMGLPLRGRPPLSSKQGYPSNSSNFSYQESPSQPNTSSYGSTLPGFTNSQGNLSNSFKPSLNNGMFTPQQSMLYYRPIAPASTITSVSNCSSSPYLPPGQSQNQPLTAPTSQNGPSLIQSAVFGLRRTPNVCLYSPGKRIMDNGTFNGNAKMPTAVVPPWTNVHSFVDITTHGHDPSGPVVNNSFSTSLLSSSVQSLPLGRVGIRKKMPPVATESAAASAQEGESNALPIMSSVTSTPVVTSAGFTGQTISTPLLSISIVNTSAELGNSASNMISTASDVSKSHSKRGRSSTSLVKRPRGRPRKNPESSSFEQVTSSSPGSHKDTSTTASDKELHNNIQQLKFENSQQWKCNQPLDFMDSYADLSAKPISSQPACYANYVDHPKSLLLEQIGSSLTRQQLAALMRKEEEDAFNDGCKRSLRSHMIGGQVIYESNKPFPALHGRELVLTLLGHINLNDAPEMREVNPSPMEESASGDNASCQAEPADEPPQPSPIIELPSVELPVASLSLASPHHTVVSAQGLFQRLRLPEPKDKPLKHWSVDEVYNFVASLPASDTNGLVNVAHATPFRINEIDGEALALLSEDNLLEPPLSMKLGPALKLHALIQYLLRREKKPTNCSVLSDPQVVKTNTLYHTHVSPRIGQSCMK